ncbi:hypothetical protein [Aquimarina agarilytica]|uniref:hypothetical protein n=1 Tax=Aquimarina agarilytica TaxID=1087449 RepID=UPI000287E8EF|nr:hypothetical protein [Aquimarina agarilytica]
MKYWKPILLVLWMVGLVLLLVFYIIPQEERLQNDTIEKLEQENENLAHRNATLDEEILHLKKETDSLATHISLSEQTIKKLETQLYEKLDRINAMSAMDLHEYIAGFKTDSTGFQKR